MKRTVQFEELPKLDDPRKPASAVLTVFKPGNICQTFVMAKPVTVPIIMTANNQKGQQMELIPTIAFEIDPDEQAEERSFILIPPGMTLDSTEDLVYRGSFLYPQGAVFFLFEEIKKPVSLTNGEPK